MVEIKFAARLTELMESENLTAEQLAEKSGVGVVAIKSGIIKNSTRIDNIIKLADYFNCSVDFLVGRTENKYTKK